MLTRHPLVLSRVAAHHVRAAVEGNRQARGRARVELRERVDAAVMEEVLLALDAEHARLLAAARAVDLVDQALLGRRFVPRW